jgi:hypothetical protein
LQLNFEDGIGELLQFVFYYGSGVFSPSVFFKHKKLYDSLLHYISRNPKYFKLVKLEHGASYYVLSEFYIEYKIGLFSVVMFPAPKDNLEVFQALIYLSLCIEKTEFRNKSFIDFINSSNNQFVLDNLDPIGTQKGSGIVITFEPRVFTLASFGQKTFVPRVSKFRSVQKILIALANLHLSSNVVKNDNSIKPSSSKPAISKDVEEYFEKIFQEKKNKQK